MEFDPSHLPRGVDSHPHKGFETVTIVFSGELEHRDSAGNAGKIGPGDVQWMTAGSGLLHEEKHSADFTSRGGLFHVVQLWVNLPKAHKLEPPGYQTLVAADIPTARVGGADVRVIAGSLEGVTGPARTFTPMNVWDAKVAGEASLAVPTSHNAMVVVLAGRVQVGSETLSDGELGLLGHDGEAIQLGGSGHAVVLTGEPIDEPISAYGPFVMNTPEEIRETIEEFQSGKYGSL